MISLRDPAVYITAVCVITVIIETAVFRIAGWRDKWGLVIAALMNVITSLALGLVLSVLYIFYFPPLALAAWVAAVLLEYAVYRIALGTERPLFLTTLIANMLSFAAVFSIHGLG